MRVGVPDYTLSQLRAVLDATCFIPSATSTQKNVLINKAREAFYFTPPGDGGGNALWNGAITQQSLTIVTQFPDAQGRKALTVTLNRYLETVVAGQDQNGPIGVRNEWQSFGKVGQWGARVLNDLSNGFCGVTNINSAGATMQITTTTTETGGLTVVFTGTDVNGNYLTETVSIPTGSGSSVSTVNSFYSITEVVKSTTAGALICTQVTAAVPTFFARYDPSENSPNWRRYQLAYNTTLTTLTAKCKRRYVLLSADNDPVEFGSALAFECAIKGYRWLQNNDMASYRGAIIEAIGYLNGLEAAYQSETAEGIVSLEQTTSPGRIWNVL